MPDSVASGTLCIQVIFFEEGEEKMHGHVAQFRETSRKHRLVSCYF
jgi:hypothetical protein